jgi:AcrR family transcriptional regulator
MFVKPRRLPTQERSRARVERILAAAIAEFSEHGYDAATTEGIAARAGTSIGSIYQFFPNKHALFLALCDELLREASGVFERYLERAKAGQPWDEVLDEVIDAFVALHDLPGFRAVWTNLQLSAEFLVAGAKLNDAFAARTRVIVAARLPGVPLKKQATVATMIVEVISAMLIVAVRQGEPQGAAIVAETKELLRRYLAPYARASRSPAGEKRPSKRK